MCHVKYKMITLRHHTKDRRLSSVKCEVWKRHQEEATLSETLQNEYDGD